MPDYDIQSKHSYMVDNLAKDPKAIFDMWEAGQADMIHHFVGMVTEMGELGDAIKKHIIYNQDVDLENILEELGDLEFYTEGLRAFFGFTHDDVCQHNIDKLSKRYPNWEYSDERAKARADKEESE